MPRQTKLERALIRMAKAAGELQRALAEMKDALGTVKPRKTPKQLVMCEKCEEEMDQMPLEREGERLYRCPKCGGEKWVKEG